MSHKLLILSPDRDKYRALIEEARLVNLEFANEPAADVDIVLGEPKPAIAALDSLPALSWLQSIWAGVEPFLGPASRRNYILTNVRGVFGGLITEFVFGYLLAHERRIFQRFEAQKNKIWEDSDTGTLRGKTIGLLGVGSIGAEIAEAAKFFGMNVRGYTRGSETSKHVDRYFHPLESTLESDGLPSGLQTQEQAARVQSDASLESDSLPSAQQQAVALQSFASGLDYLVSILPNTVATRRIVSTELLNALPAHALFINVGRGQAVDESALIEALNQNKIAGAVLDVFEQEPLPKEHPFWTTPNLLMTFHTAGPSFAEDIAKIFIENYRLFIEGKPLKYRVNFEREY